MPDFAMNADGKFGRLSWHALPAFGAEVEVDLREGLSAAEAQALCSLLFERQVLVFRRQALTHPQQIAVMEYIAPVLRLPEFVHFISSDPKKGALGTAIAVSFRSIVCRQ